MQKKKSKVWSLTMAVPVSKSTLVAFDSARFCNFNITFTTISHRITLHSTINLLRYSSLPYHAPAGPQAVRMLARVVRRARQSKERSLIGGMHLSFPLSPIGLSCNYLVTGRRERGRSGSLYVTLRRSPPFKQYFFFFFFALCICCHSFPDNALSP